jgi:hypothetical protein
LISARAGLFASDLRFPHQGWLARARFVISQTIPDGDLLLDLSDAEVRGRGERFDLVDDARSCLSPRYSHSDVTEQRE